MYACKSRAIFLRLPVLLHKIENWILARNSCFIADKDTLKRRELFGLPFSFLLYLDCHRCKLKATPRFNFNYEHFFLYWVKRRFFSHGGSATFQASATVALSLFLFLLSVLPGWSPFICASCFLSFTRICNSMRTPFYHVIVMIT